VLRRVGSSPSTRTIERYRVINAAGLFDPAALIESAGNWGLFIVAAIVFTETGLLIRVHAPDTLLIIRESSLHGNNSATNLVGLRSHFHRLNPREPIGLPNRPRWRSRGVHPSRRQSFVTQKRRANRTVLRAVGSAVPNSRTVRSDRAYPSSSGSGNRKNESSHLHAIQRTRIVSLGGTTPCCRLGRSRTFPVSPN